MKIRVACPHCEKPYAVDDGSLGRPAKCKQCGQQFELSPSVSQPVALPKDPGDRRGVSPPSEPPHATTIQPDPRRAGSVSDRSIGRFVLGDQLGGGGFGKVYRAFDPQLQRDVALKSLLLGVLSGETWGGTSSE